METCGEHLRDVLGCIGLNRTMQYGNGTTRKENMGHGKV